MFQKIKDFPRNFVYGIENLIKWAPVIWTDRNWDNYFIYKVLRHKLHLTEQNIRYNGHHVRNIEDANKIKTCVLLLDRLIEDDYHEKVSKKYHEKWGRPELNFNDDRSVAITHANVKTEKDREQERKDFKRTMDKEEEMIKQDLELLFKTMRKHIRSWWD